MARSIVLASLLAVGCTQSSTKTDLHVTRDGDVIVVQGLDRDNAELDPGDRAIGFLARHRDRLGIDATNANTRDVAHGSEHFVRVDQTYRGMPVLGGELVVAMGDDGITSVNGRWLRNIKVPATAKVEHLAAIGIAHGNALKLA